MVSGLVTSPCDQLRIFSGDARLIRMASKSAITFAISKGLERNKVVLRFLLSKAVASCQWPPASFCVPRRLRAVATRNVPSKVLRENRCQQPVRSVLATDNRPLATDFLSQPL